MSSVIRIIAIIFAALTFCPDVLCQPKALGATFSYSGVGLAYEYFTSDATFVQLQLRTDSVKGIPRTDNEPCFAASAIWNVISGEKTSRNDNVVQFLAGPGLIAGISHDYTSGRGPFAGLAGRFGGECSFNRGITLSVTVTPMLGVHLSRVNDYINMRLYRKGLMYAIMPEIGIKYTFGR